MVNGYPYPNLAPEINLRDGYKGLGTMYPYVIPLRLLYYAKDHSYPINISYIDQPIPENAFYPIGLHFFNFDIDYFALLSPLVRHHCRTGVLKILFYYHEGDNPHHEKDRLDELCHRNTLPLDCYRFISGNTAADDIDRFCFFPDHELFYWRNCKIGSEYHEETRGKRFTMLNRVHKNWRVTVVTQLLRLGLLNDSYWSYNMVIDDPSQDLFTDNPIRIQAFKNLFMDITRFLKDAPYVSDDLSSDEHNTLSSFVSDYYTNSYCNLIVETHYDADGSGGSFLTEKTFKPIRNAQPFILFGPPKTLHTLKELGYRTFDHVLDNTYDNETDNTKRFVLSTIQVKKLTKKDIHEWFLSCRDDILHNQKLFLSSKYDRLNNLYIKLKDTQ